MNKRLPAKAWFYWHQPTLLKLAESRDGRQLLGISEDLSDIIAVRPSSVTARISDNVKVSEFRSGPSHLRYLLRNWKEFSDYSAYLQRQEHDDWYEKARRILAPHGLQPVSGGTVTDFFTPPHPETGLNGVDGYMIQNGTNVDFTTLVGGTGSSAIDDSANMNPCVFQSDATTDKYKRLDRGTWVYDTSSIDDGDTVSAAVQLFTTVDLANGLSGEGSDNSKMHLVTAAPADLEALVTGDFDSLGGTSIGASGIQSSLTVDSSFTITITDLSVISKTGSTKLGGLYGWDLDDLVPHDTGVTWTANTFQYIRVYSADHDTQSQEPKLTVTHVGAGFAHSQVVVMG